MGDKTRKRTRVACSLIGKIDNKILLSKRMNTGHMDGTWSLVAGHVIEGEPATKAMIREVMEECGIDLLPQELTYIGAVHHFSESFDYINFVFKADLTNKKIINNEPEKCEELKFFPYNKLPKPMADYILEIIEKSFKYNHPWIYEKGWND